MSLINCVTNFFFGSSQQQIDVTAVQNKSAKKHKNHSGKKTENRRPDDGLSVKRELYLNDLAWRHNYDSSADSSYSCISSPSPSHHDASIPLVVAETSFNLKNQKFDSPSRKLSLSPQDRAAILEYEMQELKKEINNVAASLHQCKNGKNNNINNNNNGKKKSVSYVEIEHKQKAIIGGGDEAEEDEDNLFHESKYASASLSPGMPRNENSRHEATSRKYFERYNHNHGVNENKDDNFYNYSYYSEFLSANYCERIVDSDDDDDRGDDRKNPRLEKIRNYCRRRRSVSNHNFHGGPYLLKRDTKSGPIGDVYQKNNEQTRSESRSLSTSIPVNINDNQIFNRSSVSCSTSVAGTNNSAIGMMLLQHNNPFQNRCFPFSGRSSSTHLQDRPSIRSNSKSTSNNNNNNTRSCSTAADTAITATGTSCSMEGVYSSKLSSHLSPSVENAECRQGENNCNNNNDNGHESEEEEEKGERSSGLGAFLRKQTKHSLHQRQQGILDLATLYDEREKALVADRRSRSRSSAEANNNNNNNNNNFPRSYYFIPSSQQKVSQKQRQLTSVSTATSNSSSESVSANAANPNGKDEEHGPITAAHSISPHMESDNNTRRQTKSVTIVNEKRREGSGTASPSPKRVTEKAKINTIMTNDEIADVLLMTFGDFVDSRKIRQVW